MEPKKKKQNRPHILDKSYTESQLNKKILSKIEVPEDRALMASLFKKGIDPKNPELFRAPAELDLDKKDLNRVRRMAKEIHTRSRSRINFVPLIAVVTFVFALVVAVGMFKNSIAKKIIVSSLEGIFGAKSEVSSVDVSFLSSSLNIQHLAIGNKESVMKNLFEADVIEVDFNLTQALRGKFDAQNLEATGMAFNTDRTTSCGLPAKEKKDGGIAESEFVKRIKAQIDAELNSLKSLATDLLGGDDVESIVSNLEKSLRTPEAVQGGIEKVNALVETWKDTPAELSLSVNEFSESIGDLVKIDVSKIQDEAVLRDALIKVTRAMAQGNTLKNKVNATIEKVKADSNTVKELASSVVEAANADKNMAQERLTAIVDTASNSKAILTNAIDSVAYSAVGKAYPLAKKAISFADDVKNSAAMETARKVLEANSRANEKAASITGPKSERMEGTTFWYSTDAPSFLIEHAVASGPDFFAEASEISSNPNIRGKPALLSGAYEGGGVTHHADLVLDARTLTSEPLLSIDYEGSGFSVLFDGTSVAQKSGVPSVSGKADLTVHGAGGNGIFEAAGKVSLAPVSLSSDGFESEHISRYYNQALSSVSALDFGYDFAWSDERGASLLLDGNFADVFMAAMKTVVNSIGSDAKKAALERIQQEVNDSSAPMAVKAKEFLGIEGDVDLQNMRLSDLQGILSAKRTEIEERIQAKADEAAGVAKQQANDAVKSALQQSIGADEELSGKAADKLQGAAEDLLKGIFKK